MPFRVTLWFVAMLLLAMSGKSTFAQSPFPFIDYPSNFTLPQTVPSGCLLSMPSLSAPPDTVFFDETVELDGPLASTSVRIQSWRIGCHEPFRSAIVVNLQVPDSPESGLRQPTASLLTVNSASPEFATLSLFSAHDVPAIIQSQGSLLSAVGVDFENGISYIVQSLSASPDEYNFPVEVILDFGPSMSLDPQTVSIPVPSYFADLFPPEFPAPPLHGRYSGQWTVEGLPRSGLVLHVAEINQDRNFVFAIWFTYLNGEPVWLVGNADLEVGSSEIEIPMTILDNGGFITDPGSFTSDDVNSTPVGTMSLRAVHCNQMEADIDFSQGGLGQNSLVLDRLIRIAGYDCDQTPPTTVIID